MFDDQHQGNPGDLVLVTVFRARNPADSALAKSMLQAAGIDFATVNEEVQDLFGWGCFPRGRNLLMGPVELRVREADSEFAMELLRGLAEGTEASEGS